MNSLTRICQADTPRRRHGRSRCSCSYQVSSSGARMLIGAAGPATSPSATPRHGQGRMVALPRTSPVTAWTALKGGNEQFGAAQPEHPSQSVQHRSALAESQKPTAVVFGCADSRVAAEIIFDQGLGDMFVVRTAGHVIDAAVLGSIEYAVTVLNVPLIVVLGHDSCGAVNATLSALDDGVVPDGYVRA